MGKLNRRFNKKARTVTSPVKNTQQEKHLQKIVENGSDFSGNYDDSNLLVTASEKNKLKVKKNLDTKKKILSKNQKKKLQKILDLKKKKEKRAEILESLAKYQVSQEELSSYKSSTQLGNIKENKRKQTNIEEVHVNPIAKRQRKRNKKSQNKQKDFLPDVKSIINEETSTSSASDDDDNEIDNIEEGRDSMVALGKSTNKKEIVDTEKNSIDIASEQYRQKIIAGQENEIKNNKINSKQQELSGQQKVIGDNQKAKKQHTIKKSSSHLDENQNLEKVDKDATKKMTAPIYQQVNRTPEIQSARLLLPIIAEEQLIMETINENDVTIICGATGSGKTTQIPQFLYEAGYGTHESRIGMIGITEPRRVAAVSMSKRVAEEMNLTTRQVSYQIRYEGNTTDDTILKFMTDGVLLKEIENNFLLSSYSCIIIDEAHERSVYTDILIGLLSRIVPLRKKKGNPLKLIIMSATLRVDDFRENKRLFPTPPPVISVDGRQYPVTIHFNKRTVGDYVSEAFRKVCKIHSNLKLDGGILVFVTGQNEVLALCRKLSKTFPRQTNNKRTAKRTATKKEEETSSLLPTVDLDKYTIHEDAVIEEATKDEMDELPLSDNELRDGGESSDDEDSNDEMEQFTSSIDSSSPMHVLPLYSLLSTKRQQQVFRDPPEGSRLCVVATNVAETSLTIPGIKYIVDSGRVKKKLYDKVTGVSTFKITWTSKASANQRAGRAGRVGPGHCYRLYSSAVFQGDFEEFSEPEIVQKPVDDLVLQMKNLCIDRVMNFPFPTPPQRDSIQAAETLLHRLGALKKQKIKQGNEIYSITSLGKKLCRIPIAPRFSKMMLLSAQHDQCLQYVITVVAALTVKDIFTDDIDLSKHCERNPIIIDNQISNMPRVHHDTSSMESHCDETEIKNKRLLLTKARRKWRGEGAASLLGDLMVVLRAVGACEYTGCSEEFCKSNGLRYKAMLEIRKLRTQLTNAVSGVCCNSKVLVDPKMKPPDEKQADIIRRIVLSCLGDHVARKVPRSEGSQGLRNAYKSCLTEQPVYIHPTSSLFTKLPDFLVFHEMIETKKIYMKGCVCIEENWLPVYTPYMCAFKKPMEEPPPQFEEGKVKSYRASTFGPHLWPVTPCYVECSDWLPRFRWFARFLLEGKVCVKLQKFSKNLLTPASVMVKSWSHLQPKTESMLTALMSHDVDSKENLIKMWKSESQYLLKEYIQWLPQTYHEDIKQIWPPL